MFGRQHWALTALDDMLGPANRMGRVGGEDLPDHQPVEQHADRGEMLLYGRLGGRGLERLDIGGDVDRLDVGELVNAVLLQPGKKVAHGPVIGHAGVLVADRRSKELQEPARRMIAGVGDRRRHGKRTMKCRRPYRRGYLDNGRHVSAIAAHGQK